MKHLGKINVIFFGKCVEPCGDGKIFSYSLFTILFSIGIHVQNQHTYKTTSVRNNTFNGACFGCGFSIFQFIKNPAGSSICTHKNSFSQCIASADTSGKVWDNYGISAFLFLIRIKTSRIS